jgi:hypothetical protein
MPRALPSFDAIACRWADLADRRLRDYVDLYNSGRWTHYYTKQAFALRMRDVVANAKTWRELAGEAEARDKAA